MSENWKVSCDPLYVNTLHQNEYGMVLETICRCETPERALQIAHEHNTHAALVEALERCVGDMTDDVGITYPVFEFAKAALAAAKGDTSEHR